MVAKAVAALRLADILKAKGKPETVPGSVEGRSGWREQVQSLAVSEIRRSPFQPRVDFDESSLEELAASIREHGVLHPVVVRPVENGFELVVGERRLRACKMLGWESIPAIVREMSDSEAAEIALIENVQRDGLSFFEEAEGYRRLIEEFGLTQEELAVRLGKSQSAIANKLRLLRFSPEIRALISREMLTERHARALLRLESEELQAEAVAAIAAQGLNVRQTEEWVERRLEQARSAPAPKKRQSVKGLLKDYRLLINSVRGLVDQMTRSGFPVELVEEEREDCVEVRIRVPRRIQGGRS